MNCFSTMMLWHPKAVFEWGKIHYKTWDLRLEQTFALETVDKFIKLLLLWYQMISNCCANHKCFIFIITIGFEVFQLISIWFVPKWICSAWKIIPKKSYSSIWNLMVFNIFRYFMINIRRYSIDVYLHRFESRLPYVATLIS